MFNHYYLSFLSADIQIDFNNNLYCQAEHQG